MKIMVGISGGVDSCVSAYLLKKQGHDVLGVTMKLIDNKETLNMIKDASLICKKIGIPHKIFDFTKEFREKIINNFINSYKLGETPNPCILCNRYFKFGLMYEKCKELGYDYIATGHYANICDGKLLKSDSLKDQSYFLYNIKKDVLEKIVFPLQDFKSKEEIREIAKKENLGVYNKKDSQDICFIPDNDYSLFLSKYIVSNSGLIRHINGEILGKHDGLYKYTIGQRKGLKIAYKSPLYVIEIDNLNNTLIVGDNKDLYNNSLIARDINILCEDIEGEVLAKVRSRGELIKAFCTLKDDKIYLHFVNPVRAITKGQSVVLYRDNICLGGGIIENVYNQ